MAELDKKYANFHATWKARLALKDIYIAEGYMRGEANDLEGYGSLPDDRSKSGIHIRVEGRGIDAHVAPDHFDAMIKGWQLRLEETDIAADQQRDWTKTFIVETVGLNQHLEARGPMILLAAVWLARDNRDAMQSLRRPGHGLLCDFSFDDASRTRRLRLTVLGR